MFREGLISLFQQQPDFEVVGHGGSVADAVDLFSQLNPDVLLLDYYLPDGTGVDAIKSIKENSPEALIVLLTHSEDDEIVYLAIRNGAKGYLLKSQPAMELVNSLRRVMQGEAALSRKLTSILVDQVSKQAESDTSVEMHPLLKQLTRREMEVLAEIVSDASNKEIALKLDISVNTVKNHISNILSKLDVTNRREAASLARKYNIQ
jgi:DNA-binding NarL/FixJ family response regulator